MAEMQLLFINKLSRKYPSEMIRREEITYHAKIREIAQKITENGKIRVILLAGPSGSGKTTSANLISDAIRELGVFSSVISLDDFYKTHSSPDYPKCDDGSHDYECPEALEIDMIRDTLGKIAQGEPFSVPKYDFKTGERVAFTEYPPLENGCVIIEGLHALNPKIYDTLPKDKILKIFISVSTNICIEGKRILSGRKIRFVRRLVRDSIYRGADAKRTLEMWQGVLRAEDVYLYPYKPLADMTFDTFHAFELGVMKPFANKLLADGALREDPYVNVVLEALKKIEDIDVSLVPENSLIREFVPGGIYEHLY
ncbi:MAG: nucleoside kinase [Clostridia bacterium]|nr:nucleoside kinase [Clostridia bacterium]